MTLIERLREELSLLKNDFNVEAAINKSRGEELQRLLEGVARLREPDRGFAKRIARHMYDLSMPLIENPDEDFERWQDEWISDAETLLMVAADAAFGKEKPSG